MRPTAHLAAPFLAGLTAGCVGVDAPNRYETFSSTAAVVSGLGGPVLRSTASDNTVIAVSGTYDHATGRTVLDLGNYTLIDPDGFSDLDGDGLAELSDGTVTVEVLPGYGGFDYATFFGDGLYAVGGTDFLANGIFGIVTDPSDMPGSGIASYAGTSSAIVVDGPSGNVTEQTGTAGVSANFGVGTATVEMIFDDVAVDGVGNPVPPALDSLSVSDMTIAGNRLAGGTILADYDDALASDPVGAVSNAVAEAVFFGFERAGSLPDEVGGVVLIEGSTGTVASGFITD